MSQLIKIKLIGLWLRNKVDFRYIVSPKGIIKKGIGWWELGFSKIESKKVREKLMVTNVSDSLVGKSSGALNQWVAGSSPARNDFNGFWV